MTAITAERLLPKSVTVTDVRCERMQVFGVDGGSTSTSGPPQSEPPNLPHRSRGS